MFAHLLLVPEMSFSLRSGIWCPLDRDVDLQKDLTPTVSCRVLHTKGMMRALRVDAIVKGGNMQKSKPRMECGNGRVRASRVNVRGGN